MSEKTSEKPSMTPLMIQYNDLKSQVGDALLFFRMGDFYELFGPDAVTASKVLEITLTSRDRNKENALPMAGVPHHAATNYIQRLLKAGYKVAIGEQVEDPAVAKGIVRREIVRTFSPAMNFEAQGSETTWLATVVAEDSRFFLALLDPATGESRVSQALSASELASEWSSFNIGHALNFKNALKFLEETAGFKSLLLESLPENYLTTSDGIRKLKTHFEVEDLSAFVQTPSQALALSILVEYTARAQKVDRLIHLKPPRPLHTAGTLAMAPMVADHLNLFARKPQEPNLFDAINHTRTSHGLRLLRKWMQEPLIQPEFILERQTAVRELSERAQKADALSSLFSKLYDLDRIMGRVSTGLANPRDALALSQTLVEVPFILDATSTLQAPLLVQLHQGLQDQYKQLQVLAERLRTTLRDDAPVSPKDGGIFLKGTTPELDHLLDLNENGNRWLLDYETRERERTGIASLKVKYNRVFGYSIEITKANLGSVPENYFRKQSMAQGERFFTEELKKFEEEILSSDGRMRALEQHLFAELLTQIRGEATAVARLAEHLATLDCLTSLARLSERSGWCFPTIDNSLELEIQAGRHPLVDQSLGGAFVPNDLRLSEFKTRTLIITGPNMGGKSTVMRQVAVIIILGQMGAPVPARAARWGTAHSLHTRIGAQDAIAQGQSTFMVEMTELAHILHHANERSIVILDEIGRGTSTFDGMSVAWASLEWIATQIRSRTLFATHYHELTELEGKVPGLANAHMAVAVEKGQKLRFLYELRAGAAQESFGVHVAQMAGMPKPVVARAWEVLQGLEENQPTRTSLGRGALAVSPDQLGLFESSPPPPPDRLKEKIESVDVNGMTPIQALQFLSELQKETQDLAH